MSKIEYPDKDEIIEIHAKLVIDAADSEDPISPPGIKSVGLLESALGRQCFGYGETLKYADPISNAASLCYGICCNHSLHNGNKRTALVALLCHLDKNGYTFNDRTNQDDLYNFMVNVAKHSLAIKKKAKKGHDQSDLEVEAMTEWIRKRTRRIEKSERTITYTEFEKILREHDVYLENHKNNYVDVIKYSTKRQKKGWFSTQEVRTQEKVANIPYWPMRTVGKTLIKSVRKKKAN